MNNINKNSEPSWYKANVGELLRDSLAASRREWNLGFSIQSWFGISEVSHKFFLFILIGVAFVTLVWILSRHKSAEFTVLILYLLPVFLVTWFIVIRAGIMISAVCVFSWVAADISSQLAYPFLAAPYWNIAVRLGSLFILVLIFSSLKRELLKESELSRIDSLTGLGNRRYFNELAKMEIDRFLRYKRPFTVIYIDLDNFKVINDRFGHSKGDQLLRLVAENIQESIRVTDKIARLGGDEFAILLPETGFEAAKVIVSAIQRLHSDIMQKFNWPVAFSMGAVTFKRPPSSVDEMLKMPEDLMYAAKKRDKNAVKHAMCEVTEENIKEH